MSGSIFIGEQLYARNSSYIGMLGIFLWSYVNEISSHIADNVYRYFLFRDITLDFTMLTSKTYTLCYQKISDAFEKDLRDFPFLRGHSYTFALEEWRKTLKPMFESSRLFDRKLIGIPAASEDFQELSNDEDCVVKDEVDIAKNNRPGMRLTPGNEPVNWDVYPNEYYPIVWDFFNEKYDIACDKFDVFFKKYHDKEQIEIASLVARLMILKAKYEKNFNLDDKSTYGCFLDIYGKRDDKSIQYLRTYYESFLLMEGRCSAGAGEPF